VSCDLVILDLVILDLVILDGANALYRSAYEALDEVEYLDGSPVLVGAVRALLGVLGRLRLWHDAEVVVAWESAPAAAPNIRREWSAAYKAHRSTSPSPITGTGRTLREDVHLVLPLAQAALAAQRVGQYAADGGEGDDAMYALSLRAQDEGRRARIVTTDRDMRQACAPGVVVAHPTPDGPDVWDEARVVEHYGIARPRALADWRAISGDRGDGISGIRGLGDAAARAILGAYPSLADALSAAQDGPWTLAPRLRRALLSGRDDALLSLQLATLWDLPLLPVEPPEEHRSAAARLGLA